MQTSAPSNLIQNVLWITKMRELNTERLFSKFIFIKLLNVKATSSFLSFLLFGREGVDGWRVESFWHLQVGHEGDIVNKKYKERKKAMLSYTEQ